MRAGMFALIRPVITSTDGRCVASTRWMPAARAFCAMRAISCSTFLPTIIIMSANSSITTTMYGRCTRSGASSAESAGHSGSLHIAAFDAPVVSREVANAERRHQAIAAIHLCDAPAQAPARLPSCRSRPASTDAECLRIPTVRASSGRRESGGPVPASLCTGCSAASRSRRPIYPSPWYPPPAGAASS